MNTRLTWYLVIVAGALLAHIVAFERGNLRESKAGEVPLLFPELRPEYVSLVEITRSNEVIRVERETGGDWRMIAPPHPAESVGIQSLLQTIASLRQRAFISPQDISGNADSLVEFGLEPNPTTVTITEGTNRFTFNVGAQTLLGEQVYLQSIGRAGVFTVSAELLKHLPANATQWRDPMLVPNRQIVYDSLTVTNGPRVLEVRRDTTNEVWLLTKPITDRADRGQLHLLLQQLVQTPITEFVTDDPRADLEAYGLHAPPMELALLKGGSPVFHVQIGSSPANDPTLAYARRLHIPGVVLIPKNELVAQLSQRYEAFRDRSLVAFRGETVARVEVRGPESFVIERQTDESWMLTEPSRAPADLELVQNFLSNLAAVEIVGVENEVVADFSAFGLAPPARQFVLRDAPGTNGTILAQADFSTNQLDRVFARRAEQPAAFVVPIGDLLRLPLAAYELRDRRVWNFTTETIHRVAVHHAGRDRSLSRQNGQWSNDSIAHESMEELLLRLGRLRATSWVTQREDQLTLLGFRNPARELRIQLEWASAGKSETLTLEFGNISGSGEPYAATHVDGRLLVFKFPPSLYQQVIQQLSIPAESLIQ